MFALDHDAISLVKARGRHDKENSRCLAFICEGVNLSWLDKKHGAVPNRDRLGIHQKHSFALKKIYNFTGLLVKMRGESAPHLYQQGALIRIFGQPRDPKILFRSEWIALELLDEINDGRQLALRHQTSGSGQPHGAQETDPQDRQKPQVS